MKVPLLSLVATETEELRKHGKDNDCMYMSASCVHTFTTCCNNHQKKYPFLHNVGFFFFFKINRYSRHNLCVVDQVLQRVAAGEVIIEVCRVADQPLVRSGCVYVPSDDNRLDT